VGGPLICVIEDEEAIAAAVAARLRAEEFAVEVAADGPAGVALCERLLPDRSSCGFPAEAGFTPEGLARDDGWAGANLGRARARSALKRR
jgi:hypothetical protein